MNRLEPKCWSFKSNPTLARKREPDRRYAISSTTSAEERKLDRRFAYANLTLVQHRQTDADLQPTISTFYQCWFDVTLQTNSIFWNNSHHYVKYQLNPCHTIPQDVFQTIFICYRLTWWPSTHPGCFRLYHGYYMSSSQKKPPIFTSWWHSFFTQNPICIYYKWMYGILTYTFNIFCSVCILVM
jgi:hypothetical protein